MPKIFNIRGTSGSGKSTIVYSLLNADPEAAPFYAEDGKTILGHTFAYANQPFAVVGKYTTPCGGCDAVPTQDEIQRRVRLFNTLGRHVIFEGLLVTGIYGRYAEMAKEFGPDYWWCFMSTPLETCIERIKERRAKRGDTRLLNTTNTEHKHAAMVSTVKNAMVAGFNVRHIEGVEAFKRLFEEVA